MAGFGQDSFYAADYESQNQNQDIGYVQSGYGQPGQDQQFGQFDYGQQPGYGDSPYGGQQPSTFNPTIMTPDPQAYGAPPGDDFEGEPPLMEVPVSSSLIEEAPVSPEHQLVTVYQTPGDIDVHELKPLTDLENSTLEIEVSTDVSMETPSKKRRKEEIVQASSALLTLQEHNLKTVKVSMPGKATANKNQSLSSKKITSLSQSVDENEVVSTFQCWLASVTERINQTMHYQFDGNPEPLVFHAPQYFFDCLQQRISSGNKKKRLPNFTTAFVRKDALPLGTFTKYTWHITNVLHVKQIFDTPEMALEITRNFVENRDSTYDLYEVPVPKVDADLEGKNQTPIRPSELKTFLKVGNTSPDQKSPTPFIIEWIPDILPKSHIGELRIKFEYGHHRNGYIEQRNPAVAMTDQTSAQVPLGEHITFPIS